MREQPRTGYLCDSIRPMRLTGCNLTYDFNHLTSDDVFYEPHCLWQWVLDLSKHKHLTHAISLRHKANQRERTICAISVL